MSTPKEEACKEAYRRGVDETVRTVARNGSVVDPHGLVYERIITLENGEQLDVYATFEAGMNQACVTHIGHGEVYHAYRYGTYIHTFRRGHWLDELEKAASALSKDPIVGAGRSRRENEQAREDQRFRPVD